MVRRGRFHVFHRTWWREADPNDPADRGYPNGLVPSPGKKHTIARVDSEEEALEICRKYRETHDPGRLSDKAEYQKEG